MARAGAGRPSRHKGERRGVPRRQWDGRRSPSERQGRLGSLPHERRRESPPERKGRLGSLPHKRRRGSPSEREDGMESASHERGRGSPPERKGRLGSLPHGQGSGRPPGRTERRRAPPGLENQAGRRGKGERAPGSQWGRPPGLPTSRGGVELLYGRNAVLEALRAGRRRAYALAVAGSARAEGTLGTILALAEERHLPVREVEREELDRLAPGHQGIALEASPYPYADFDALVGRTGPEALFLLLDLIEDPQNLGTLLRTADAVGVAGVVIPARRAASVTPAVSNASAGAVEYLPVAQVTNLVQAMEALRAAGVWLAGLEDLPEATLYDQADWSSPTALVVGSEGRGMRRLVRERCDFVVRLPMAGHVTSLNAAVAGSIVLYHAWRSRQSGG